MGMIGDLKEERYTEMKRRAEDRDKWRTWMPRTCARQRTDDDDIYGTRLWMQRKPARVATHEVVDSQPNVCGHATKCARTACGSLT